MTPEVMARMLRECARDHIAEAALLLANWGFIPPLLLDDALSSLVEASELHPEEWN